MGSFGVGVYVDIIGVPLKGYRLCVCMCLRLGLRVYGDTYRDMGPNDGKLNGKNQMDIGFIWGTKTLSCPFVYEVLLTFEVGFRLLGVWKRFNSKCWGLH